MRPLLVKSDADIRARNGVFDALDAQTARFPTKQFGQMELSSEAFVPSFQCVFKTKYFASASTEASSSAEHDRLAQTHELALGGDGPAAQQLRLLRVALREGGCQVDAEHAD